MKRTTSRTWLEENIDVLNDVLDLDLSDRNWPSARAPTLLKPAFSPPSAPTASIGGATEEGRSDVLWALWTVLVPRGTRPW